MNIIFSCAICIFSSLWCLSSNNKYICADLSNDDNFEKIELYEEVLFSYYLDYLHDTCRQTSYSFEDFENNYYSLFNKALIIDYVDIVSTVDSYELEEYASKIDISRSSDGKFQLGCGKDAITSINRFQNGRPFYNTNYYNLIQAGDIFIELAAGHFQHVGVVTDLAYPYGLTIQMGTYVQVIEAINNSSGVQFGYIDDQRIIENQIEIYRYHLGLTTTEFNSLHYFLDQHIGNEYHISIFFNTNFSNNKWYCGELVYAAYLYAGINIAPTFDTTSHDILLGLGICDGTNAVEITIERNRFLSQQLVSFNTTQYCVRVQNNASKLITVYYASSTVAESNAMNWSNLGSVSQVAISSNSFSDIVITRNSNQYIATSFCYTNIGRVERLITYAYITSGYSLIEHNVVIFE